ncbi:MAG TPA: hypothetical protein VGM03_08260 [Phycisphaerae bacterium]|jgi:hypothetical protein
MVESIPQIAIELPSLASEALTGEIAPSAGSSPAAQAHVRLRLQVDGELWSARLLHLGSAGVSLAVDLDLAERLVDGVAAKLGFESDLRGISWMPGRVYRHANALHDDGAVIAFAAEA